MTPKRPIESEKNIKIPESAPEDSTVTKKNTTENENPIAPKKPLDEVGITAGTLEDSSEKKPIEAAPHAEITEMRHGIQHILTEELKEFYNSLPNAQLKKEFGQKGDEISKEIESLIRQKKITIVKIKQIIEQWLNEVAEKVKSFSDFYVVQEIKDASDALVFALKEYLPEENIQR